jgi:hypothetical protein
MARRFPSGDHAKSEHDAPRFLSRDIAQKESELSAREIHVVKEIAADRAARDRRARGPEKASRMIARRQ